MRTCDRRAISGVVIATSLERPGLPRGVAFEQQMARPVPGFPDFDMTPYPAKAAPGNHVSVQPETSQPLRCAYCEHAPDIVRTFPQERIA
ncbi:hypothetical protein R69919_00939 [Paraburkholderia gardini]|nr:hypothetical protein R69919_00939 [Paraburkholderia gardini]